jgi:hypothetical protein
MNVRLGVTMASMSASDAAPLPRLGEVFFDVRGSSRSMRLSWYADTGIAVFSIWQGGTCTGTFRLPMDDLPRLMDSLRRGMPGGPGPGGQDASGGLDAHGPIALGGQRPRLAPGATPAEPFTGAMTALPDDHAAGYGGLGPGYGVPANGAAGYGPDLSDYRSQQQASAQQYPAAQQYPEAQQYDPGPQYADIRPQQYGDQPGYDAPPASQSYQAAPSYANAPAYPQPQSYPDAPAYSEPGHGGSQAYGYQGQAYEGQGYDAYGYDDQGYAAPGRAEQVPVGLDSVGSFGNRGYNVYDQTGQADADAQLGQGSAQFGQPEPAVGYPQAAGYSDTPGYAEAAGYSTGEASPSGAGYAGAPDPAYQAHLAGTYGEAASYPNGSTYSGTPQPTVPTFTPTFAPSGPAAPGYRDGAGYQAGYQGQGAGYPGEQSHAGEQSYGVGGYPAGYPEEPQAAAHPATPTFTPISPSEQVQPGYWSGDPRSGDPQAGWDSREQGYAPRR